MTDDATTNARSMLRLLNGLARKGSRLEAAEDGFHLVSSANPRPRQADPSERRFAVDVVRVATRQGWIAADGAIYRLTEAGALALHSGLAKPATVSPSHWEPSRQISPIPIEKRTRRSASMLSHQMEAAERLAEDFQIGQMTPRVTSNWDRAALGALSNSTRNPSGRGVEVSERTSAAQERVRRALVDAGPEFADVLIDLCCLETGIEAFENKLGWPRRSAKLVLGLALDRLARHYGIVAHGPQHGRARHWGESDYRPT